MRTIARRALFVFTLAATAALTAAASGTDSLQAASLRQKRLARGKYLVEGPAHCFDCHSEPDVAHGTDQPIPGRKGAGMVQPADLMAAVGVPPGSRVVCPNITPDKETGAGSWSDADFVRALRQGIGHDGRTLFPMMPYMNFHNLADEDLASIITYIRSIPPVHNPLPKTSLPPALFDVIKPLPPVAHVHPDLSTPEKRGGYLVKVVGNCSGCHTPMDEHQQPLPGMYLAGGQTFPTPWGEVTSVNLTPDASGISYYTRASFIQTIRTGHVGARKLNAFMPFSYFRNLSDSDLGDIYAYLRTVPPVQHRVDNTEPATFCKVCKRKHGFGGRNQVAAGQ